ncbi:NMT1/THI5 like protein [uncultured archaeon]|nr:NMT1/THI5 like protein [uncultured archaeon]
MNLKMKNGLIVLAAIAVIAIIAIVITSTMSPTGLFTQSAKSETIKLGNLPVIQGLPIYLAIEKGYFSEAGLSVELTKFDSPSQLVDAVMQGKLDLTTPSGAAGISAVANYKNPGKIKLYALSGGTAEVPNEVLLIPIDSNINSIKELKGKKLGLLGGSIQWRTIARDMLAKNGLEADKDVYLVELATGLQVQALATKQIDALLALEPTATIAKEKKAGKILLDGPMEETISDPFYPGAGIINLEFAKTHPEIVKKFIEVVKRATKEIKQNPVESEKYLKNYTALTDDLIGKVPMSAFKICEQINAKDIEALQKFYDLFEEYNVVDGRIDANAFLYCTNNAN